MKCINNHRITRKCFSNLEGVDTPHSLYSRNQVREISDRRQSLKGTLNRVVKDIVDLVPVTK